MKITAIEAIPLEAQQQGGEVYWGARIWGDDTADHADNRSYPPPVRRRYLYAPTYGTTLVRVETDDGVVGWGECKAPVAPVITAQIVKSLLASVVIDTSLQNIAQTWERMYAGMRVRGHDSSFWLEAISGVDIALWDAWARTLGQPLWALLGGRFRDRVPVYASGIPAARIIGARDRAGALDSVERQALALRELGFTAIKVAVGADPASDAASVAIVRDVLGERGHVFADAAGSYDVRQALTLGERLEESQAGFFEMPVPPENVRDYSFLAARLRVPLALDSIATRHRALQFLSEGALHILQPDVCRAGGITETMRIAALADAFGAQATPHISIGSAVHFAASLQCALAIPNLQVMEHWVGENPLGSPLAADLDEPADGHRIPPLGSGLGITIDEHKVYELRK